MYISNWVEMTRWHQTLAVASGASRRPRGVLFEAYRKQGDAKPSFFYYSFCSWPEEILYAQFSLAVSKTVATSGPDGSQTAVGSTVTVTDGITESGHTHNK